MPGRLAAIASTSPAWASEVTSTTPSGPLVRPRATRSAKNAFHAAAVSQVATLTPSTSRWPSAFTPVATSTTALTTRSLSRTFIVSACAAMNVNGPASVSGRVVNAVTCSSRSAAIRETCDFGSEVIPRVWTSLSTRRVETLSR